MKEPQKTLEVSWWDNKKRLVFDYGRGQEGELECLTLTREGDHVEIYFEWRGIRYIDRVIHDVSIADLLELIKDEAE